MTQTRGEVVLALDVGTGGARVSAYDLEGMLLASASADYPTYYDHPAWAEQEPEDWWIAVEQVLQRVMRQLDTHQVIGALGLTGQSPTIAPFDAARRPLRRALLYQDNRATGEAALWSERIGGAQRVHARTGHTPAAFYIGPKILWVQTHEPDVFARADVWLQPRDYIAYRLTGIVATDWSHAGSTLLFDVNAREWAQDIFEAMRIPSHVFPAALPPWSVLGDMLPAIASAAGLPARIPVVIGGADSQCCVVGAGVLNAGQLSDMAGTSTCLNAPVPAPLSDQRIANYCHILPEWWCTELGLNASGAAFEWIASTLTQPGSEPSFSGYEARAREAPPGAAGLIFLPYIADGERNDPMLRGGFCGLSLRHGRAELVRAVLEGVAYAIREHLDTMAAAGAPVREIHVSGGGARSALWNQIKADVTGTPVIAVASDATSLGVALLAGSAVGLYPTLEEAVNRCVHLTHVYEPDSTTWRLYTDRFARFTHLAQAIAERETPTASARG